MVVEKRERCVLRCETCQKDIWGVDWESSDFNYFEEKADVLMGYHDVMEHPDLRGGAIYQSRHEEYIPK